MSPAPARRGARTFGPRGALTAAAALVASLVVAGGGTLLPTQEAPAVADRVPVIGRTSVVCTVGEPTEGSTTSLSTVVMRQEGREGTLTGTTLTEPTAVPLVTMDQTGLGVQTASPPSTVVLTGQGAMATSSAGAVVSSAPTGVDGGVSVAPCLTPGTAHWLVGVGARAAYRSEIVLTNPDDAQAEVDLRYYGRNGLVVVPGSPGVVLEGHASQTLDLASLVNVEGPLSVSVRVDEGRVSAVAHDVASSGADPAGSDWQASSTAPSTRTVIAGVGEGEGSRELFVVNPGGTRAEVRVEVLGEQGAFVPAGAESVVVGPESTGSVDLTAGLAGAAGAVRLTSTVPVTGSIVSRSTRAGAATDLAVHASSTPISATGLAPVATTDLGDSELVLSNDGDAEALATIEVISYDGVTLREDEVLMGPGATSTRLLNSPAPSYLVVSTPEGSKVHGGIVWSQPDGGVAGLATVKISSPDVAARAPHVDLDPAAGR